MAGFVTMFPGIPRFLFRKRSSFVGSWTVPAALFQFNATTVRRPFGVHPSGCLAHSDTLGAANCPGNSNAHSSIPSPPALGENVAAGRLRGAIVGHTWVANIQA